MSGTTRQPNSRGASYRIPRILAIACVWLFVGATAWPAAPRLPEPVAFLTDGLAAPYFSAMRIAQLTRICATRFAAQCQADDVDPADLQSVDPAVFDRVKVLGQSPAEQPAPADRVQWAMELRAASSRFRAEYFAYEKELFSRLAAIQSMCPDPDPRHGRELIATARTVNFARYWALESREYTSTMNEIGVSHARYLREIRDRWSPRQCAEARAFGLELIKILSSKLRPYTYEGWQKIERHERMGMGAVFVWYFGMRAQGVLQPEVYEDALDRGPDASTGFNPKLERGTIEAHGNPNQSP